ncbi:hypothetical protein [Nocardia sp. NPDC003979]
MKYYVDWSDRAFPEIAVWEEGTYYADPITFAEASRRSGGTSSTRSSMHGSAWPS